MALALQIEPTPLHTDEHGVVRVGPTRVTLDQVVHAFRDGVTPEEIAMRYDTLDLGDVYSTVAYYLHHPESVNEYLERQAAAAENARQEFAEPIDMKVLRERLLARQGRA